MTIMTANYVWADFVVGSSSLEFIGRPKWALEVVASCLLLSRFPASLDGGAPEPLECR